MKRDLFLVLPICTICEALNYSTIYKESLSEVHKLLWLYLTLLISSAIQLREEFFFMSLEDFLMD